MAPSSRKAAKKIIRTGSEIYPRIVETLEKMGGKALESNLLEELKKRGIELDLSELRQMLMKLEIRDKIRVLNLDEERKLIELLLQKE